VREGVTVPVIASCGAGNAEHFYEVLAEEVDADAALAASMFHYKETSVAQVKEYLRVKGVAVR
uniref:HisA/HisF-related TIM barrel protein n=1 Tax=Lysinibacillus sp. D4B1_S16 TaxID=2941231 RepID=UPI0020BECFB1